MMRNVLAPMHSIVVRVFCAFRRCDALEKNKKKMDYEKKKQFKA